MTRSSATGACAAARCAAATTSTPATSDDGVMGMTADCILALSMRRFLSALALVLACSAPAAHAQTATAIVAARLIDGTGAAPIADAVVIVEGDRITAAGPRARVAIPRGTAT